MRFLNTHSQRSGRRQCCTASTSQQSSDNHEGTLETRLRPNEGHGLFSLKRRNGNLKVHINVLVLSPVICESSSGRLQHAYRCLTSTSPVIYIEVKSVENHLVRLLSTKFFLLHRVLSSDKPQKSRLSSKQSLLFLA